MIHLSGGFPHIFDELREMLITSPIVKTERWQGVEANQKTREIRNVVYEVDLRGSEDLEYYKSQIAPNLPWADDHFLERVGGHPLNPGEQWKNWPFITPDAFKENKKYNHNYMERLWPKYARRTADGKLPMIPARSLRGYPAKDTRPIYGIAHHYGDLQDLVELLAKEPYTRQAYIPLFFPEDTGLGDGGRKPCTLGYQFLVRNDRLHIWYPMRSCDFLHHFRDDNYLGVRLLLWVLDQCRKRNPDFWDDIRPGTYSMHITSLHVFDHKLGELK